MRKLIKNHLQGKKILFLFFLTNIVYVIMLAITIPKVMNYSAGLKLLDMVPAGYDATYVNTLLNTLGEKGRDIYLYNQIPWDMVYPLLFGISYCLIFDYFLKKLNKLDSHYFLICYLPLLAGLFDYSENIGIISILNIYPDNSDSLSQLTSIFSVLKSSFTTIYFILLIIVLIIFGVRKLNRKENLSPQGVDGSKMRDVNSL